MSALAYALPSASGNSAVPWWDYARHLLAPVETGPPPEPDATWSARSARPMFGTASGIALIVTDDVPSGAALPTVETESAVISRVTSTSRIAMRAALWARITGLCRDLARHDADATAVSPATLEHARWLLAQLPEQIALPQATVSSEGEIIFTWFHGNDRLDAILAPEGHLTWVFRISNNIADGGDVGLREAGALSRFYGSVSQFYA